jgi:Ca2+-dependent lipid-binding protein
MQKKSFADGHAARPLVALVVDLNQYSHISVTETSTHHPQDWTPGESSYRSKVIHNTLNPTWNEGISWLSQQVQLIN